LRKFVSDFTNHLKDLHLDENQRRKAEVQLATIKAQLDEPNPVIIAEAGRTLRNITEGAIASLLATAAQPTVWQWVHSILTTLK
jgi:hypothetical protein